MAFLKVTSPHAHGPLSTDRVMKTVVLSTLPGLVALTVFFGIGSIINVLIACTASIFFEAISLKLRNRNISFYLKDFSAIVTAVLLALALPPYAPWWLIAVGCFFSIVIAKQLYGGLGYNPFNPAMVGYVVLLISFPVEMTRWVVPNNILADAASVPGIFDSLKLVFGFADSQLINGYTFATPLDILKQNNGYTLEGLYENSPVFSAADWAGAGWEWVNAGFLLGGAYLLYKKIFTWHAPVSMLLALIVLSALFYDGGSSTSYGSPVFHLFSGGTMLAAFFIITDPVSSAVSNRGRLIFGAGIGALIFVIRAWGNYPDAVAFSVLLMNFAAPFIDYYTKPRTYGHKKRDQKKAVHEENSSSATTQNTPGQKVAGQKTKAAENIVTSAEAK